MSDEIMLVFGEDGVAREYDDTWDITIHCESEEEQKVVLEKLNNSNQEDCNELAKDICVPFKDTISRQAAIDVLCNGNCHEEGRSCDDGDCPVVREIKALPSAQPEPCEDAVSREMIMRHWQSPHFRRRKNRYPMPIRKQYGHGCLITRSRRQN